MGVSNGSRLTNSPMDSEFVDLYLKNSRRFAHHTSELFVHRATSTTEAATVHATYLGETQLHPGTYRPEIMEYRDRFFRFKTVIDLPIRRDADDDLFVIRYEDLGIHVFAETRDQLKLELAEQICLLWDTYAGEEDDKLTPKALVLKKRIIEAIEEIADAELQEGS